MKNYAVILASGMGCRFGSDLPKQFTLLNGKTILERSVEIFDNNSNIDKIIVVITPEYIDNARNILKKYKKIYKIISGGKTRKESSYNGITAIEENEANVLIHDCARPILSQSVLNRCVDALDKYNAVAVAVPSSDTIIEVQNNIVISIPSRENMMKVQTPQCFKLSLIKKAHELSKNDTEFTDDCGLVVKNKLDDIYIVEGDYKNIKITYPEDIEIAELFL